MEKNKSKSIVVKEEVWKRLSEKIHFNGISSMNELISKLLDVYEKEVKKDDK